MGTDHEGKFVFEGVPVGKQRVTVVTTLGDYKPFSKVVEVKPRETAVINFRLEPARRVNVTFNVIVPKRTPKKRNCQDFRKCLSARFNMLVVE